MCGAECFGSSGKGSVGVAGSVIEKKIAVPLVRHSEGHRVLYYLPVPVSSIVCGSPEPVSETTTAPVSSPVDPGVKVTEIVHFPFGASDAGQVLV